MRESEPPSAVIETTISELAAEKRESEVISGQMEPLDPLSKDIQRSWEDGMELDGKFEDGVQHLLLGYSKEALAELALEDRSKIYVVLEGGNVRVIFRTSRTLPELIAQYHQLK